MRFCIFVAVNNQFTAFSDVIVVFGKWVRTFLLKVLPFLRLKVRMQAVGLSD
jgi:hypothetical protein